VTTTATAELPTLTAGERIDRVSLNSYTAKKHPFVLIKQYFNERFMHSLGKAERDQPLLRAPLFMS
jgi:hypothetical protein